MENRDILLKGTPASPGVVEGKVRIILGPEHVNRMQSKEILVVPFTNPLYTLAILKASALVTDKGGMMCHAAIIAREFGIPCVAGTENATKKLIDGMKVIVDGEKGIVYR